MSQTSEKPLPEGIEHKHDTPDGYPSFYARLEKEKVNEIRVHQVEKIGVLTSLIHGQDAKEILKNDPKLEAEFETLITNLQIMRNLTDPDIKLFVLDLDYGIKNENAKWICYARSEKEVRMHQEYIARYNTYIQNRKNFYAFNGQDLSGACHFVHQQAYTTLIDGERVVERGVGDHHSIVNWNSIFFEDPSEWDHEIAFCTSTETGSDLIVDFTIGDDIFRPFYVFKTPQGIIFGTNNDFKNTNLTPDQIQDLDEAKRINSSVSGILIIEHAGEFLCDCKKIPQEARGNKFVQAPLAPSIPTVLYARTWTPIKDKYHPFDGGGHSYFSLNRNWGYIDRKAIQIKG